MEKSTNKKPKDGVHTEWYKNGNKKRETSYKDDYREGLNTTWYENGQKSWEGIVKVRREAFGNYNDFRLYEKLGEWNEDGSVKE